MDQSTRVDNAVLLSLPVGKTMLILFSFQLFDEEQEREREREREI